jgi:hypothetical protein
MSKSLSKVVLWSAGLLISYVILWNILPKARNREMVIGRFDGNSRLDVVLDAPADELISFFIVVAVESTNTASEMMIEWSLAPVDSEKERIGWTNQITSFAAVTNRINLTGPGNSSEIGALLRKHQLLRVRIEIQGTNTVPIELGFSWMTFERKLFK